MGKSDSQINNKGLKKGPWTREEDHKLLAYIKEHGRGSWRSLPSKAGLERCGKSCRLRWTNYLRPDIKRGKFSTHEEKTIIRLHALLGNRWSAIAAHLPKRTDNEIKNYWNTRLKKRLARMGIDPTTHKPKNSNPTQSQHVATLSHMVQWEAARLEAEARASRPQLLQRFAAHQPPHLPPREVAAPPPPCLDVLKVWRATARTLDSPTSTLSFSSNTVVVPAVGSIPINTFDDGFGLEGKMENFSGLGNVNLDYDSVGAVGLAELNRGQPSDDSAGEFEDVRNYWNDILNLVSSPMELPGFLDL